jgi:hypothetical protein
MAEKNKTCFIIMPLTTPDSYYSLYMSGRPHLEDKEHFRHVLKYLFIPAVEKAEMTPIPPEAEGAEVIQGKIIKDIESADLVLCDISTLNPNVFFELGIRTSLNKPVCMVKDDMTEKIPFDNSITNHYTYKSSLLHWEMDDQVIGLSAHIKKSSANKDNQLWKYFGLSSIAAPIRSSELSLENVLGFVSSQIESLRQEINSSKNQQPIYNPNERRIPYLIDLANRIYDVASKANLTIKPFQPELATTGIKLDIYVVSESTNNFKDKLNRFERDIVNNLGNQFNIKRLSIHTI